MNEQNLEIRVQNLESKMKDILNSIANLKDSIDALYKFIVREGKKAKNKEEK